jgi:hypothetical protein
MVDEHRLGAAFDFDLNDLLLWKRAIFSTAQRRGKTALLEEIRMSRKSPDDHAITDADLAELDGVLTGRQIWDVLASLMHAEDTKKVGFMARTAVMNRLLNEAHTKTMTVRELCANKAPYTGRQVEYLGKAGVFTDIGYMGATNTYHFVLDGSIYGAQADTEVKVLPGPIQGFDPTATIERVQDEDIRLEAKKRCELVRDGFTAEGFQRAGASDISQTVKASWALEHLDEIRGRTIQIRRFVHPCNDSNIKGIVSDAWASSKNAVTFVINGRIAAEELETEILLFEPQWCRTTKNEKHAPDGSLSCMKLRHHFGDHKF